DEKAALVQLHFSADLPAIELVMRTEAIGTGPRGTIQGPRGRGELGYFGEFQALAQVDEAAAAEQIEVHAGGAAQLAAQVDLAPPQGAGRFNAGGSGQDAGTGH